MTITDTALSVDWLAVCRRSVEGLEQVLTDASTTAQRVRETGTVGSGGDRTLLLDAAAEDVVFEQLDLVARDGHRFHAVSEERGEVDFGSENVRVVIDPIDGSLNAKRSVPHYALSVAVADGPTMADVVFGFVHDFGAREQFWAWRDRGAWYDPTCESNQGRRLDPTLGERRNRRGRLELVGIEAADPRYVRDSIDGLAQAAHRLRALGAVAITLCEVAAARMDGMVTLIRSRGVDSAAGQLIVREAGGVVSYPDCDEPPLGAPLDSTPSSRLVAARTERGLHELEQVVPR
jgi:myo-inositol-1(or 4)-monophosphatase